MRVFWLERIAQRLADTVLGVWPRRRPSATTLANCMIVAHRGEHDNEVILENTLAAFELAAAGGVDGIEFDLRWTADLEPVVIHDPDARRVFGLDLVVAETGFADLRTRLPEVPSLAEVVGRFGGRLHLMIELKSDDLGGLPARQARLEQILGGLRPGSDFHILALAPELFDAVGFAGRRACMPVGEFNLDAISRHTLEHEYAGISGHYLLLSTATVERHLRAGQQVGCGFVASRFCLYREANRGVRWIFSNRASSLAMIRRELLARG